MAPREMGGIHQFVKLSSLGLRLWQHNHTPSLDAFVQDDCIQEGAEAGPQQLQFHQTWPERYKRAAGNEKPVETKLTPASELVPTFA